MYRNKKEVKKFGSSCQIWTPMDLSYFIFDLFRGKFDKNKAVIFDPCAGSGNLLVPFFEAGYKVKGVDLEPKGGFGFIKKRNFLLSARKDYKFTPDLILINPPFSVFTTLDDETKKWLTKNKFSLKPFFPEIFLRKTIELFGKNVPILLFTPFIMRLGYVKKIHIESKRYKKFKSGDYPQIKSIISLPLNLYNKMDDIRENILFHSEILIFNVDGLKPHYFF